MPANGLTARPRSTLGKELELNYADQEALVTRILAGDETAYETMIAEYQAAVRGFAAMWAPSRDEADDIAQEVFLAAFRGIQTFDRAQDLKIWLLGIARNLSRQAWRRVARQPQGNLDEALEIMLEREAVTVYQDRERDADRRRGALYACIENLPKHTAEIFRRFVIDEERSADLARHLKTTDGSIRSTISRVRRGLKDCIKRRLQREA